MVPAVAHLNKMTTIPVEHAPAFRDPTDKRLEALSRTMKSFVAPIFYPTLIGILLCQTISDSSKSPKWDLTAPARLYFLWPSLRLTKWLIWLLRLEGTLLVLHMDKLVLRSRISFLPTFHLNQVLVSLFSARDNQKETSYHCSAMVRAVQVYFSTTASFRKTDSLFFVIPDGPKKGASASLSAISWWLRQPTCLGLWIWSPCPFLLRLTALGQWLPLAVFCSYTL